MAVRMHVSCAVSMYVFVLVEDDFEMPIKSVGDTTKRLQAGNMIAAFQTRNHGLGHSELSRQLLLRLAGMSAQLQQLPCAPCSKARRCRLTLDGGRSSVDDVSLAKLLTRHLANLRSSSTKKGNSEGSQSALNCAGGHEVTHVPTAT